MLALGLILLGNKNNVKVYFLISGQSCMYFSLDALPEIQILEVIYPMQTMWFDRPMCKF